MKGNEIAKTSGFDQADPNGRESKPEVLFYEIFLTNARSITPPKGVIVGQEKELP